MKNSMLGLLLGLCAAGMVQAQEVVDRATIQVGAGYSDEVTINYWGYSSEPGFSFGSLVLPMTGVDVYSITAKHWTNELGSGSCSVGFTIAGDTAESARYLKTITGFKYGDFEFDVKNDDGYSGWIIFPERAGWTQLAFFDTCAFTHAVEAAYPDGSIVNIAITREVADPLPPVIVPATLGVDFSLRAGYPNQVPAIGGAIRHSRTLSNLGVTGKSVLYWITTRVPGGLDYPLLTPRSVTVAAGSSFSELKTFNVPVWFPAGNYSARLVMVDPATGERVTADIPFGKSVN